MTAYDHWLTGDNRHPTITRTSIVRTCPHCAGEGELVVNDTNPYGYGPDPQCDEPVECAECGGDGEVTEWRDPLVGLSINRRRFRAMQFHNDRARAYRYSAGLAQADMLARAQMCATAADRAAAAWQVAA